MRVPRLRGCVALLLLTWRLTLAPTHIGLRWLPSVRVELYHLLFGDRNYLQVYHLPVLYCRKGYLLLATCSLLAQYGVR